ncbi:flagellar biosynthetic protein FliO [Telluria aromaticivorans]|uniref:Flagellar protein n=1 Tax=Telluria aromaticivorans TaxID=2725995 RepID=A0A7Y2NZ02_9BURK|nr:flagellar biosynthetic protein FliO [Telluria aromaticivorans]NNG22618.1 flagellar biosynthetic protein FliO [Telluria aromaticivorans]
MPPLTITAWAGNLPTLRVAAAALLLPLSACAAPVGADQTPAAQQQVSAPAAAPAVASQPAPRVAPTAQEVTAPIPVTPPASVETQPLPRGATTAGRPATPARPAPSGPISTPVQGPGPDAPTTATPAVPAAADTPAATTTAPAATPAPGQRPPQVVMPGSATPGAGSLLQTILALVLVLALLLGMAWVLKRFGPRGMMGASANLKLVGALNIGGRERIMVVEVGDQWIVVGASPGRVNALATMPRQEGAQGHDAQLAAHTTPAASFGDWLKNTIDKRNAK